ncbi:hypothetical protein PGTUg99_008099 [Puccinia graminis f. sp. tritici]|uniref:Secreted protein n=1 Tax=Puccinia graminis f. sp. tritici TaxID=56615 RepID=A0A5B0Q8I3_PUCGR|nr:hypothetical protein PGTUg99_008099 [Puccinia graminis f. sp. tritici]
MRFNLLSFSVLRLLAASVLLPGVLAGITVEETALKVSPLHRRCNPIQFGTVNSIHQFASSMNFSVVSYQKATTQPRRSIISRNSRK